MRLKKTALLLVLILSLALSPTVLAAGHKIGYNYFGNAGVLITLANNSKYVIEAFGGTAVSVDNQFSVDKIVTDLENLIASGVDGLLVWAPTPTLFPVISQMCLEAGVPFVLNDKVPMEPELRAMLRMNPYFVGGVAPTNADYGRALGEYVVAKGYKTCIVNTSQPGDPSDEPRLAAFREVFEANGGVILDIVRSSGTDGGKSQVENSLIAHQNPDFIYGVGPSFAIGAIQALERYDYDTTVVTSGLEEAVLDLLAEGKIEVANGDNWICGTLSALMLQSYLDGNPLRDENGEAPIIDTVGFYEVTAEQVELYKRFFIEEHPYSVEEILSFSGPDFDFAAFMELIENYTLENRMAAKAREGKVTIEELKAVGINVQ